MPPARMGIALGRVGFGGVKQEFWCERVELELSGYLRGEGKEKCESWAGNTDLEGVDMSRHLTPRAEIPPRAGADGLGLSAGLPT